MGVLSPENDTGGRADSDADFPGAVLEALSRRPDAVDSASGPLGGMATTGVMPADQVVERNNSDVC
jgi:hypothetical protein